MAKLKAFRLHDALRENLETHCRRHLMDERAVVEAWILRFLEASTEERQAAADRYLEWLSEQEQQHNAEPAATGDMTRRRGRVRKKR